MLLIKVYFNSFPWQWSLEGKIQNTMTKLKINIILELYTRLIIWKLEQIINYPLGREINLMKLEILICEKGGKI